MLLDAMITALNDGQIDQLRAKALEMSDAPSAGQCVFTKDGAPLKVLVAEDNIVNQMVIKAMLDKLHCDVVLCSNGQIAVDQYTKEGADIILMDISMPVMDGSQATRHIRRHQEELGVHTPIIGVTAHAMREDRQRCIDAGMDDYLPKPVKQDALKDLLAKWTSGEPGQQQNAG